MPERHKRVFFTAPWAAWSVVVGAYLLTVFVLAGKSTESALMVGYWFLICVIPVPLVAVGVGRGLQSWIRWTAGVEVTNRMRRWFLAVLVLAWTASVVLWAYDCWRMRRGAIVFSGFWDAFLFGVPILTALVPSAAILFVLAAGCVLWLRRRTHLALDRARRRGAGVDRA